MLSGGDLLFDAKEHEIEADAGHDAEHEGANELLEGDTASITFLNDAHFSFEARHLDFEHFLFHQKIGSRFF